MVTTKDSSQNSSSGSGQGQSTTGQSRQDDGIADNPLPGGWATPKTDRPAAKLTEDLREALPRTVTLRKTLDAIPSAASFIPWS
ncbi:hypothetical protein AA103587_0847 [Gluconobacter kanchanaburiensis NBRC 103587]|nr:hypothetical protein AA103587_0847 [Gluconobacter kanchanaburiensis NBRC 103587]